jgi:hypothetical protein
LDGVIIKPPLGKIESPSAKTTLSHSLMKPRRHGNLYQRSGEVVTTNGTIQTVTVHVSTPPIGGRLFVRVRAQ